MKVNHVFVIFDQERIRCEDQIDAAGGDGIQAVGRFRAGLHRERELDRVLRFFRGINTR